MAVRLWKKGSTMKLWAWNGTGGEEYHLVITQAWTTVIAPNNLAPWHHQYRLPTMGHHLLTVGYCLPTVGYLNHLHPLIRASCFHHQPHQPRERKRTKMGVMLEGIRRTWPRMDLRMEPALPPTKRPVRFPKRQPRKLLLRFRQCTPQRRPVKPWQLPPRRRPG